MSEEPIPNSWARATIGELIGPEGIFVDGDWVESKDQDPDGDVRLIQLADVGDGVYRNRSARFLTSEKARELGCTYLHPGDVLIARMPDPLGRACVFPGEPRASVTVVDVCIVRTETPDVDQRWLMWAVNSPQFRASVASLQSGSTRKRISRGNLATLHLPVPPAREQRRIVAAIEEHLSDLDASVASLTRARRNLPRYQASVLIAAIRGKASVSAGGEISAASSNGSFPWPLPDSWRWVSTADAGDILLGRQRAPQYLTGRHSRPYLRVANVGDDWLDLSDLKEMDFGAAHSAKYALQPGDILVSEGQSPELVGQSAIYRGGVDGLCFQKTLHRFRANAELLLPEFAQIVFRAFVKTGIFQRYASLTVNIAHLTLERFKAVPFPLPPLDAQHHIVAEVDRRLAIADRTAAEIDTQLARAARLRQSILARAFAGKLVPQDPSDEPASTVLERIRAARAAEPTHHRSRARRAPRPRTGER